MIRAPQRNIYDFGFQRGRVLNDFHRRLPAYRIPGRMPFDWMLTDGMFRQSRSFNSIGQVIPPNGLADGTSGEDIFAPGESKEDQFSIQPGGFLRYVSGNSANAAGFKWELLDGDTDWVMSDSPIRNGVVSGEAAAPLSTPGPFLVPVMQGFPNGANLIVRITNLNLAADSTTRIQLVLWFAAPLGRVGG